ncbi:ester cyclase [Herbidospora galbida]|uniref:Ester cyclase n=1 Tax=Herbidospora galbida TaxID=2575442 RepID=A0A4U3MEF9_9ACTN|nr:ester cyclase [Herbidospora galbida]TKK86247.1 ester cyclase [Herbidospora galbida]
MTSARELKDLCIEAYNRHDVGGMMRHFAPAGVLVTPAGIHEGREQVAWYYAHWFAAFSDLKVTAWMLPTADDPAVTEFTITGTHDGPFLLSDGAELPGTGRRIALRGVSLCTIEDDLIVTDRDYYDQLELYSQLGLPVGVGVS